MGSEKTQFKKGQSGNPTGRPKLPAELIEAKRISSKEFELSLFGALKLSGDEIEDIIEDRSRTNLERLVARLIYNACEGDTKSSDIVLNRAFGKPKDILDVNTNPIAQMSDEEKLEKAKLAVEILSKRLKADE